MEKLNLTSPDLVQKNIETIAAAFPNVITEVRDEQGNLQRAVDFDLLKQELSAALVEGDKERYQLTWPGKRQAILQANAPIDKTLRPVREDSMAWDTTQNLYIEGDNLEVLKLLQESYLNKVKCIYIDPPYNTGKDFIYKDDFRQSTAEYLQDSGQVDEAGNRLFQNNESNGRFHSDWLTMMYPRLKLARSLLRDDGVIFISIDDNEIENLKKICDEVFGAGNATVPLLWLLPRGINAGLVARSHEYILCYAKNLSMINSFNSLSAETEYSIERCNKKIDDRHPMSEIDFPAGIRYEGEDRVITGDISGSERIEIVGKMVFSNGRLSQPVTLKAGWTMRNMILQWLEGLEVHDLKGQKILEFFFKENGKLYSKKEITTLSIKSVLKDMPDTQKARIEMEELFDSQDIFPYPKTKELPKLLIKLASESNDTVLDFFSGSATTAHAVMQLNAEDGGNRQYITVQLPETTTEDSEAYKAGYKNICEIGKERIRRAAKKIQAETNADIDYGFRVFRVDSSNMKDVYRNPQELNQDMFSELSDNIKDDRTGEDLLIQVMLAFGLPLSLPMQTSEVAGCPVYYVAENSLVACFADQLPEELVRRIAGEKPLRVVFRDSSFASDAARINVEEIFKAQSPATEIKVL